MLENSGYGSPDKCAFSNDASHYYEINNPMIFFSDNGVDAARIIMSKQDNDGKHILLNSEQDYQYFDSLSKSNPIIDKDKWCDNVEIGENILIFGYPYTGGEMGTSITITEGIISGHDGKDYTTSAKIEHGNSGGIAISPKKDCFIGIPTSAFQGDLETLGRILKWQTITGQ